MWLRHRQSWQHRSHSPTCVRSLCGLQLFASHSFSRHTLAPLQGNLQVLMSAAQPNGEWRVPFATVQLVTFARNDAAEPVAAGTDRVQPPPTPPPKAPPPVQYINGVLVTPKPPPTFHVEAGASCTMAPGNDDVLFKYTHGPRHLCTFPKPNAATPPSARPTRDPLLVLAGSGCVAVVLRRRQASELPAARRALAEARAAAKRLEEWTAAAATGWRELHSAPLTPSISVTFHEGALGVFLLPRHMHGGAKTGMKLQGFTAPVDGVRGQAEAAGSLAAGDVVCSIAGTDVTNMAWDDALKMLSSAPRPLTVVFARPPAPPPKPPAPDPLLKWTPSPYYEVLFRTRRLVSEGGVWNADISPCGRWLAVCQDRAAVDVYDLDELLTQVPFETAAGVSAGSGAEAEAGAGAWAGAGVGAGAGAGAGACPDPTAAAGTATRTALRLDSPLVASLHVDEFHLAPDLPIAFPSAVLPCGECYASCFSPCGTLLATAGYSRQLRVWRVGDVVATTKVGATEGRMVDLASTRPSPAVWRVLASIAHPNTIMDACWLPFRHGLPRIATQCQGQLRVWGTAGRTDQWHPKPLASFRCATRMAAAPWPVTPALPQSEPRAAGWWCGGGGGVEADPSACMIVCGNAAGIEVWKLHDTTSVPDASHGTGSAAAQVGSGDEPTGGASNMDLHEDSADEHWAAEERLEADAMAAQAAQEAGVFLTAKAEAATKSRRAMVAAEKARWNRLGVPAPGAADDAAAGAATPAVSPRRVGTVQLVSPASDQGFYPNSLCVANHGRAVLVAMDDALTVLQLDVAACAGSQGLSPSQVVEADALWTRQAKAAKPPPPPDVTLLQACDRGQLATVQRLLAEGAVTMATRDPANGNTPLIAACRGGHIELVEWLLANGADPNLMNEGRLHGVDNAQYRTTALAQALRCLKSCRLAMVKMLLDAGADVDAPSREGLPLHIAVSWQAHDRVAVVETLLARARNLAGGEHECNGESILHYATRHNVTELIPRLVAAGAPLTATTKHGGTPLHRAIERYCPGALQALIAVGASVDDPAPNDERRYRPLHLAAKFRGLESSGRKAQQEAAEMARILVNAGATVNGVDATGWTPLHMAVAAGNLPLVELLLASGADQTLKAPVLGAFGVVDTSLPPTTPLELAKAKLQADHPVLLLLSA